MGLVEVISGGMGAKIVHIAWKLRDEDPVRMSWLACLPKG